MKVKGIVFDVNGTLTDIRTNEWHDDVYRVMSNFLSYQGILLDPDVVKFFYFQGMKDQREACVDRYPEYDAVAIFRAMITQHSTDFTRSLPAEKLEQLPRFLAELHRAASRFRLQRYPGVEETIRHLHQQYRLSIISDAQTAYAIPELHALGLSGYFDPIIVSGNCGYRKPDERLFAAALDAMSLSPGDVLFVGNDMYRDVYGAHRHGMKTVLFKSSEEALGKESAKPDYIIYRFAELLDAVRFFESRK